MIGKGTTDESLINICGEVNQNHDCQFVQNLNPGGDVSTDTNPYSIGRPSSFMSDTEFLP